MYQIITNYREETFKFAKEIAKQLNGGEIIFLKGNLGSGKTTFTQGLALSIGIKDCVNSPTFVIMKQYFNQPLSLIHIDAYRLEGITQDLGFLDYLDNQSIMLIEWAEYLNDNDVFTDKIIEFEIIENDKRKITYYGFKEVKI